MLVVLPHNAMGSALSTPPPPRTRRPNPAITTEPPCASATPCASALPRTSALPYTPGTPCASALPYTPATPCASVTPCASDHPCQTVPWMSAARPTMAFKNEVVSDADIDRYHLPFPKGGGRWWTRDAERDYYLWGGIRGNLAYEVEQEGIFCLYVDGQVFDINIQPGNQYEDNSTQETVFVWSRNMSIEPQPSTIALHKIISVLKEALTSFGSDGRKNAFFPKHRVLFDF